MASVNTTAGGSGASGMDLVTGAVTPGGSSRAVLASVAGDVSAALAAKYDGSSGTDLVQQGADQVLGFGSARMNCWGAAGSPAALTTGYADWTPTAQDSVAASFAFLENVDQVTPFDTPVANTGLEIAITLVAEVVLSGLTPGKFVCAALGVLSFVDTVITANNPDTTVLEARQGGGGNRMSTAILTGIADASGDLTLQALLTQPSSQFCAWGIVAVPVNNGGSGPVYVYNPLSGRGGLAAQPLAG